MSRMSDILSWIKSVLQRYVVFLEQKGARFNFILALVCTSLLAILDWYASPNLSFGFFYLLPIALTTWFSGITYGYIVAALCAASWAFDHISLNLLALLWNILSCLGIFLTLTILVQKVKEMLQNEYRMARTDSLTGVMNSRAFNELIDYEILRQQRQSAPFSIGFVDLDDFKQINDRFGHQKGDQVLRSVASCLVRQLRKTDLIARYGGDEFVIYLPNTDSTAVRTVISKVMAALQQTVATGDAGITVSLGVVTCPNPPESFDDLISVILPLSPVVTYAVAR